MKIHIIYKLLRLLYSWFHIWFHQRSVISPIIILWNIKCNVIQIVWVHILTIVYTKLCWVWRNNTAQSAILRIIFCFVHSYKQNKLNFWSWLPLSLYLVNEVLRGLLITLFKVISPCHWVSHSWSDIISILYCFIFAYDFWFSYFLNFIDYWWINITIFFCIQCWQRASHIFFWININAVLISCINNIS